MCSEKLHLKQKLFYIKMELIRITDVLFLNRFYSLFLN